MMPVVSEAAFQPTTNLREMREPSPVRGEVVTVCHCVTDPEALQRQIRQRGRRFPDREARMRAALDEYDVIALNCEYAGKERSGESAPDDDHLARFQFRPLHIRRRRFAAPRAR